MDPTPDFDPDETLAIPAAGIGKLDLDLLAQTQPDAAAEIARLDLRVRFGEETAADFLRLCELLASVGATADAEYLLRRNLDLYEGHELYRRLFGSAKEDEYRAAVDAFARELGVTLAPVERRDFLVERFRSTGGPLRPGVLDLLARPCAVEIRYAEPAVIEAEVRGEDADDPSWLLFAHQDGHWTLLEAAVPEPVADGLA